MSKLILQVVKSDQPNTYSRQARTPKPEGPGFTKEEIDKGYELRAYDFDNYPFRTWQLVNMKGKVVATRTIAHRIDSKGSRNVSKAI